MASHRRTAAAGFAVILASVSLYPIYTGLTWFWAGCGSVIVIALTGTLTRLRRLPVAVVLLAYVVALLLWLNFAFSNAKSLWHLLPTPASLAALFDIAGQGFNDAARYAPPVPELRGMVLLGAAGIGITALLTDLIAVRLGSAALAGLPLLLLFTEPFTLSVSRGFLGTTVAFCVSVAGYLALLSSEARDRIREWEHPHPTARDEPDTQTLAAAGRRVGFASVILALCLPLFIPGLHTTRLFGGQPGIGGNGGGGGGSGSGGSGVVGFPDPNQRMSTELHDSHTTVELTYTTNNNSDPGYLQIYTLDALTDAGWRLPPRDLVPVSPSLPKAPGLTASGSSITTRTATVKFATGVQTDTLGALPVPYPATTVKANGTLRADKSTLMVFDTGVPFGGLSYQVTSLDEMPPMQALRAVPPPAAPIAAHYLAVPPSYDSLKPFAQSITKGAKNSFDDALALQTYFSDDNNFKYTLNAPTVLSATALTNFLEKTKAGYCQQFSYAMAVLARLLGIPSRVAYGFTAGSPQSNGTWTVTNHDAHAWPELYFQGYGWLRFEPTPWTAGQPGQATAYAPGYTTVIPATTGTGTSQTLPNTAPTTAPTGRGAHVKQLTSPYPGGAPGSAPKSGAFSPWEIFGLVVTGLVVLAAVTPWCARSVIRRRRWRRRAVAVPAGADRVRARDVAWAHAAWQELRDDLVDYGAAPLPSESPRAVAASAGTGLSLAEPARAALGRITMAEERARYAPAPSDGSSLRADSAAVRRAIAAAVPREARWRARLLPASVVSPALNAVASAADLYRGSRRDLPRPGKERSERQPQS